jgi:autotransporter adhesin
MTYFQNRCYFCHSSVDTNAHAARPAGAGDAHGFNTRANGTAFPAVNNGYAFIRRPGLPGHSIRSIGATTYTPSCATASGICSRSMGGYTPGGVY